MLNADREINLILFFILSNSNGRERKQDFIGIRKKIIKNVNIYC